MTFDPKTFIKVSRELESSPSAAIESHCRSIVNRAYYGAFGYIRNKLSLYSVESSVHKEVYMTLINSTSPNQQLAGKKLEGLFKKRKEADYRHNLVFKAHSNSYFIKEAEEIIRLFDTPDEED